MSMAFQGQFCPCESEFQNRLELENETLTLIASYAFLTFTPFVAEPEARYQVGWVLIGFTLLILSLNVYVIVK